MNAPANIDVCATVRDPKCQECSKLTMQLAVCPALASSEVERAIGLITGWGMFAVFLIPLLACATRRTSVYYWGFAPFFGAVVSVTLQSSLVDKRPQGSCIQGVSMWSLFPSHADPVSSLGLVGCPV